MMVQTDRETVRQLCRSVVTRLENQQAIECDAEKRQGLLEEVSGLVSPYILTEQDLHEKALARIGLRADTVADAGDFNENEQYRSARSVVRKELGDDELRGLFYQRTIREIASMIADHFMESKNVEEVYEGDEELRQMIVEAIKRFNPKNVH